MLKNKNRFPRPGFILFFLAVGYFIFLIRADYFGFLALQKNKKTLDKALAHESEMLSQAKKMVLSLEDGMLIEEIARVKLGLIKKGEHAYKIVN